MKTLNKTLSLVLVLVMVLGMFGMAGAAFTDQKDAKYNEAVEVMTGIGAINGYTDGSIKPTGTITREEAAKLIVYSILGKNIAEKLTVGATGFKDVDAGRWSAPFISYLVGEGVIAGMGDGTFAPTANVTGYQFAKMMLCANGYGAKGEFVGSGWELATAVQAGKAGIFDGATKVDYEKAATREEAMLYAFNGIQTAQVSYNKLFDQYQTIVHKVGGVDVPLTIADEVYPTLTAQPLTVDGVASYRWMYKGQPISGAYEDAKVLATSKDGTAWNDLKSTSSAKYIGYQPDPSTVTYYVNGVEKTAANDITAAQNLAANKGVVVKFLDTSVPGDSKYDVVSITNDAVATLSGDVIVRTVGADTLVTVPGVLGLSSINAKNVIGYEGLKKDDVVLWHDYDVPGGKAFVLTKCGTFTGTLQATNTYANSIMVDGKTYDISGIRNVDSIANYVNYAGKANTVFYTDAGGYVVKAVPTSATVSLENTLIVAAASDGSSLARLDTFGGYKAKVYFGNGTSAVIDISKIGGKNPSDQNNDGIKDPAAGSLPEDVIAEGLNYYTYVKNDNGTYNLTKVSDQGMGAAVAKGNPTIMTNKGAKLATASTIFMYLDPTTGKISNYIGIANAPSTDKNGAGKGAAVVSLIFDARGYVTLAVVVDDNPDTSTVAKDYVFIATPGTKVYDSAKGNYYTYQAVVNGEIKMVNSLEGYELLLTNGRLYSVDGYVDGRISSASADSGTDGVLASFNGSGAGTAVKKFAVNGTTISYFAAIGDTNPTSSFLTTEDCKFFIIDDVKHTVTAVTAADIAALYDGNFTIFGVEKSSSDPRIAQLFVTIGK